MTAKLDALSPGAQRDATVEWPRWCDKHVENSLDPLSRPFAMRAIRRRKWEERIACLEVTVPA
jgi:hypothetical protein